MAALKICNSENYLALSRGDYLAFSSVIARY